MSASYDHLPILDLSRLHSDPQNFLAELRHTAHSIGFFYVSNHGVPQNLIDQILELSRRFFALPETAKLEIEMIHSPHFRGYNRKGQEFTRGQRDWREQVDIAAEREALPLDPDAPWKRLQGPNQEGVKDFV